MISNEARYEGKHSLEMQLFLAENPEMINAATVVPAAHSRSPPKELTFEDQVYARTSAHAANKMLLPRQKELQYKDFSSDYMKPSSGIYVEDGQDLYSNLISSTMDTRAERPNNF